MTKSSRHYQLAAVCALVFFIACTSCSTKPLGADGSVTIDELVKKYESAHLSHDIELVRSICFWNTQRPKWAGPYSQLETPMQQVFDFELQEARFVPGPKPTGDLGGEVAYYIPGENKQDAVVGSVYGKLVLVGNDENTLDPSYVVMKFDNRYFIDVAPRVLIDAADSVRTKRQPRYVAAPLEEPRDPRKGEKARRFD